jgi:hypothetical protein
MALLNIEKKEIHCKLVYYGPGVGGKTSNLIYLRDQIPPPDRSELLSIATETERTLFFDCWAPQTPPLRGFRLRWHLYTVPGAVLYVQNKTKVLQGADGIVFVADSQRIKIDENRKSLRECAGFLQAQNKTLRDVPIVLQYNKRDVPDILTVEDLDRYLNPFQWPRFETVAGPWFNHPSYPRAGEGVMETFQAIRGLVVDTLLASSAELADPTMVRWADVAKRFSQKPYSDTIPPLLD